MGKFIVIAVLVAGVLGVLAWRIRRLNAVQRERDAARKRWALDVTTSARIGLAPDHAGGTPIFAEPTSDLPPVPVVPPPAGASRTSGETTRIPLEEQAAFLGLSLEDEELEEPLPVPARLVRTPDGEMVLTAPPFQLRRSIVTAETGELLHRVAERLPAGLVLCPRVRLESLVEPQNPQDRDPDDWREWRRRVRLRSVDGLVCRVSTGPEGAAWRPVLAIEVDPAPSVSRQSAPDRIVDEVLEAAGLAVVHVPAGAGAERAWQMVADKLSLEPVQSSTARRS